MAATVLLVDDHPLVRRGLATLLGTEPWVSRVVEAGGVREGATTGAVERADVAVVDLGLPDGDGATLVAALRRNPGCPVLVLTMTGEPDSVRTCLDAGATGYLLKDSAPDTVLAATRTVLDGGLVLGPGLAGATTASRPVARLAPPLDRLSPTEARILALVAEGMSNGRIATEVGVAEKTVRNRLTRILQTIGARDRVQAALLARDHGLRRPDTV